MRAIVIHRSRAEARGAVNAVVYSSHDTGCLFIHNPGRHRNRITGAGYDGKMLHIQDYGRNIGGGNQVSYAGSSAIDEACSPVLSILVGDSRIY